jgi:hypothetical protein
MSKLLEKLTMRWANKEIRAGDAYHLYQQGKITKAEYEKARKAAEKARQDAVKHDT